MSRAASRAGLSGDFSVIPCENKDLKGSCFARETGTPAALAVARRAAVSRIFSSKLFENNSLTPSCFARETWRCETWRCETIPCETGGGGRPRDAFALRAGNTRQTRRDRSSAWPASV